MNPVKCCHIRNTVRLQNKVPSLCAWIPPDPCRSCLSQLRCAWSIQGVRETVAKAVVLECLRGARRQERSCYLYAFSSYGDIRELELSLEVTSLPKLLDFLEHSFNGGTDVTGALELTLDRVQSKEWSLADILIVTDGEMPVPDQDLLTQIDQAQRDLGLEVYGLLVGNRDSQAMEAICSHLHVFQSWSAAGRRR